MAETQQPYSYSDQNPVNLSDPDGLWVIGYEGEGFPTSPLMTPDQCKNFLNTLSVVAKGGPTTVSAYEALEFFSCANLENDQAQNLVNAFNMSNGATISFVAYEQIYRQDTGNLEEGVYVRYFGSGNHFYGSFAGDIYIHTNKPIVAAAAYNLIGRAESARYVETVEGFNCEDYLGGGARTLQSTYLIGGVAGGQSGVTQYDAFNADDWIYGTPKPTSEGSMPQPLGSGSSGSTNRCHGHHPS